MIWVYKMLNLNVWNLANVCINIANKTSPISVNPVYVTHYLNLLSAFVKNAYHREVNMLQIKSFASNKISELKHRI